MNRLPYQCLALLETEFSCANVHKLVSCFLYETTPLHRQLLGMVWLQQGCLDEHDLNTNKFNLLPGMVF